MSDWKFEKLKDIIEDKLGVERDEITPDSSFVDDFFADSLDAIEMIMEIEKVFGVKIPQNRAESIRTVGNVLDFLGIDYNKAMPRFDVRTTTPIYADVVRIVDNESCMVYDNKQNPRIQFLHVNDISRLMSGMTYPSVYSGDILFKHPFLPNTYVDAKLSEHEFFRQKLDCFSRVCQLLGAKNVSGQGLWVEQKKLECDTSGNVRYKVVGVSASGNYSEQSRIEREYSLRESFVSSFPNIEEAERLANQYGLLSEMRTLIDGRRYGNTLLSRDVTVTLSNELNKAKEIAFSLNAFSVFKFEGRLHETIETVSEVKYNIHVDF